jgi:2-methylfumaryl-CoA hydratase
MKTITKKSGHFLEDFKAGQVFRHKGGKTITEGLFNDFTEFTFTTNPLAKNAVYAKAFGFAGLVCPPGMVMNVVFSQTVEDISENARANLGYVNMQFGVPVYIGDTLEVETTILKVLPSSKDNDRGVVTVQSTGRNQNGEIVLTFQRSVQVWKREAGAPVETTEIEPKPVDVRTWLPAYGDKSAYAAKSHLTREDTYFEDFEVGTLIEHSRGRVVTEEHISLTGKLDNTSQVHCNQYLIDRNPDKYIGGKLLVYGGVPFNLCLGLSSPDVDNNSLGDLIYTSGKHVGPIFSGDTVFATTEIRGKEDIEGRPDLGRLITTLRGHKFVKKGDNWEKVAVFELERELAVKRRSHYA